MQNKNRPLNNNNYPRSVDTIEDALYSPDFKQYKDRLKLVDDIDTNPQVLSQPPYLYALALTGKQQVNNKIQNGEDPSTAIFHRITTMTPLFVYAQSKLDASRNLSSKEKINYKSIASEYNALLRDFMSYYPDSKISDLENYLLDSALYVSAFDQDISKASVSINNTIKPALRGALHEYCVEQQLQYLVENGQIDNYRTSSVAEDLKGIDFIAVTVNGKQIKLDVKASLSEIEAQSHKQSTAYHYDGNKTIVYSLARDAEFKGKLTLEPNLVQEKSGYMYQIIDNITLLRKAL